MYNAGPGKFLLATMVPANALAIAKIEGTLSTLRTVLLIFQVLLGLWLASMATVAVLAFFFRRNVDLRTPRVEIPPHLQM
jgi:P2-related tail formation protein